ncbi:MAG: hypothetical protein P1U40_05025 [Coxiellaceae bacterium]|nr:hypothetical protein [Coxiellaceae bacterium]
MNTAHTLHRDSIANNVSLWTDKYGLVCLLALSFLLRIILASTLRFIYYPDEIFQTLEPAHHLAFGYGYLTWEWQDGIRSWLLPGFFAGIMKICNLFSHNAALYINTIQTIMVAFSLIPIYVTYRLAQRFTSNTNALLAAAIPAFWYEGILVAARALSGTLPAYLLIFSAYALLTLRDQPLPRIGSWFCIGAVLGLVAYLRFPLLPEVLFTMVYCCRKNTNVWKSIAAGFLLAFMAGGILDWITWGHPFQSIIKNIDTNIFHHVAAAKYGASPWYYYVIKLLSHQLIFIIPFMYFTYRGAKKNLLFAGIALLNILSFSLIGHKEYRFILLTVLCITLLTGLGIADYFEQPGRQTKRNFFIFSRCICLFIALSVAYYHIRQAKVSVYNPLDTVLTLNKVINQKYHGKIDQIVFDGITNEYVGGYTYVHTNTPLHFILPNQKRPVFHKTKLPTIFVTKSIPNKNSFKKLFCQQGFCAYQYD